MFIIQWESTDIQIYFMPTSIIVMIMYHNYLYHFYEEHSNIKHVHKMGLSDYITICSFSLYNLRLRFTKLTLYSQLRACLRAAVCMFHGCHLFFDTLHKYKNCKKKTGRAGVLSFLCTPLRSSC